MPQVPQREWFGRTFQLGLPVDAFPDILERLRGTSLRLAERMGQISPDIAARRHSEKWSALEHAGHLSDLELLWLGRIDDLSNGLERLRAADLENRATWEADHNARSAADILLEFRTRRSQLISRVESLDVEALLTTAIHPRLEQPMTPVDLCFFVAEHDDHHLASITALAAGSHGADV